MVTDLDVPPQTAFDLSLDVNAHTRSMAATHEMAVAGVTSGRMELNDEVTWRAWHFGVRWSMTSRITEFDRPRRFVDEQVRGPFAKFRHEHVFRPIATGTRMTDRIEFAAHLGWLGRIVERMLLASYLEGLIRRRNDYLSARAREL